MPDLRPDLKLIAEMVCSNSRVLDVGCGDGLLLRHLWQEKKVDARGIELGMAGVNAAVRQGLAVIQGDADTDLENYPDQAFDYVILSQTLQATRNPREVLRHLLRIGRRAIVSFPNFCHWKVRLQLLFFGRMPVTPLLKQEWYDTSNIHLCSIKDFIALCHDLGIIIEEGYSLNHDGHKRAIKPHGFFGNLVGEQGVFLLNKEK